MKTKKSWLSICLAVILVSCINAQPIVVNGKVTDAASKKALAGVSVVVKGTSTGVVTDTNGDYKISTEKGKKLVFSFVGYESKTIKVTASKIDVSLNEAFTALEEVVAIGYGTQKMKSMTGAIRIRGKASAMSIADCQTASYANYPVQVSKMSEDKEEYGTFKENRFRAVKDEALSTFSLDVDAASYSNIRRIINQGQMPPKDAVRIEELVNYFSYNYAKPTGTAPVNIVTEATDCPWNKLHKLVRIGVKAKEIPSENLPASNFVFLLDVSGSMDDPNKLPLVKSSIKLLTNNLRKSDRVAIVVYAGAAGVVLQSTEGTDKQKILEAVEALHAGGSTAGGAGIDLAYKIAEKNFIEGGNNRIILCTDGDFNVGISNPNELENMIEAKRKTGVFLTVLGYGMGNYKDNKLQILAEKGNGNHAYIDNIQEANKVLVNEFGSTMYTVAKDVKIQVEFNPAYVNAYRLIGYESRMLNKEDFNDDTKDAGELGSGHTVTALYEIIPVGVENTFGGVDDLKYQKKTISTDLTRSTNSNEMLTVKLRYKLPAGSKSEKIEVPVYANEISKTASSDLQFVMAVAMFGQLLRQSDFKGDASYDKALKLANNGIGNDPHGYRKEFVRLVESVSQMQK